MCIVIDLSIQNRHCELDDSVFNCYARICGIFGHVNKGGAVSKLERPLETGLSRASLEKGQLELVGLQALFASILLPLLAVNPRE